MKRLILPLIFLVVVLAACSDNTSEVGTGSEPDAPIPVEPNDGIGDGAEPLPDSLPDADPVDEEVITDKNIVDPRVVTPTEVVINPDNPNELWVRFVGGAAACTAADAMVITETPNKIEIELVVGITKDALVKSCPAGEFNLRVDVELNEPATGKNIFWTQAAPVDGESVLITPDLTTDDFIGLTEEEAAAIADENMIAWRTVRVDEESFMVTMDYSPSRLNFEIDNGVITVVTLG